MARRIAKNTSHLLSYQLDVSETNISNSDVRSGASSIITAECLFQTIRSTRMDVPASGWIFTFSA